MLPDVTKIRPPTRCVSPNRTVTFRAIVLLDAEVG